MTSLLSEAGRSFLRAFAASLIILLPGVLAAPNFNGAVALGLSALIASLAAGLKVIQAFIPKLTFASLLPAAYVWLGAWIDAFVRAFLGAFIVSILGILAMPDLSGWKSLVVGALVGALAAGFRALQGLLTPGEYPSKAAGLHLPGEPPQVAA